MDTAKDPSEQYINDLLADLQLDKLEDQEKQKVLEMLRDRFSQVIFNTTVRLLPEEFKLSLKKRISMRFLFERTIDKKSDFCYNMKSKFNSRFFVPVPRRPRKAAWVRDYACGGEKPRKD